MNHYFMETHHHEWILTNKLGGYALGTGNLINQRKYHGLLISSDKNFNRMHLIAGLEEKVEWRGEFIHLDSNNYSNCIYPEGFLYLVKPWLRPYPIFLYSALPHQNDILILKELKFDEITNTVMVKYTNLGHHMIHIELHPKFTMHNHHELNPSGSMDWEQFETSIDAGNDDQFFHAKRISNNLEIYGYIDKGLISNNRYSYYNVYYPWEVMNGYPGIGDQLALFEMRFDISIGESRYILFSDKPIDEPHKYINRIEKRYIDLPLPSDFPALPDTDDTLLSRLDYNDNNLFSYSDYLKLLEMSLKDFIANDDIVAGYPWYGAWGRDTMVVVNALIHSSDCLDLAERILRKYSKFIQDGLIPNMLPESGRETNYDSVDATLWYIIMLYKLGKRKQKIPYWKEVIHLSEQILSAIIKNYKYPFFIREDGLIELKPEFAHATWMDIKYEGIPITPRNGAPVEINALWYNAIAAYEEMCNIYNLTSAKQLQPNETILFYKTKVYESFQKFWTGEYLADRLVDDKQICDIRPNALLALSLPWQILSTDKSEKVFWKAYQELYTSYGIRSLTPKDSRFRKKYYGKIRDRDYAYHNGSVWAWLLGAFCGLYLNVYRGIKPESEIKNDLSRFVDTFRNSYLKGHIASVAELWDGDAPHFPKGAPAMALSVAALYNIETFINQLEG